MPRQPFPLPSKRRTRAHVLADLSVNHVEKCALQCGFAVTRLTPDYGLDLAVFTFDAHGFRESGVLWMQVKATDHLWKSRDGNDVLIRIERRDLLAWIAEAYPVFLIVYDGQADRAYWLYLQQAFSGPEAFARLGGKSATVAVPAKNILSPTAFRLFRRHMASVLRSEGELE